MKDEMRDSHAMMREAPISVPALILGVSGLVPFVGLLAIVGLGPPTWYAYWLVALSHYGAVILTFVGALHWGYAIKRNARGRDACLQYGFSVAPALIAWLSLLFPVWTALQLQAAALLICCLFDHSMSRADPVPAWFLRLRTGLTLVAAGSLALVSVL